jgi:hypothetical protein
MGHSGRETEELVDQTDFAYRAELLLDAVTAADHAHDFKTFDCCRGSFHPLEAARRPDQTLKRAVIRLNDVVQVFRCPMHDLFG